MRRNSIILALAVAVGACGKPRTTTVALGDTLGTPGRAAPMGDTGIRATTPADTVYVDRTTPRVVARPRRPPPERAPGAASATAGPPPQAPPAASGALLPAGTVIGTTAIDSVHSGQNKVGDAMRVRVNDNILANGRVVIPAGSVVTLTVAAIAGAPERGPKGTLVMNARDVEIGGKSYPLSAGATDYRYEMKNHGVGAAEIVKTGAGAAVGAVIGGAIGGKVGTVVGAVGGGVAGAAVARKTADYQIVVHAGAPVTLELRDDFRKS